MKTQLLDNSTIEIMEFRIQQEELSARIYEQMKLWFEDKGYLNFAKLYDKYVEDEKTHAGWAKSFLLDYGYTPRLKSLSAPFNDYTCCSEILEATLEHELVVTKQCEELFAYATDKKLPVLMALGLKYCTEQQEEIGKSMTILDISKLTSDLLALDGYIGEHYLD